MSGRGLNWRRAATTHCVHGHEYTPENTLLNGYGWRYCRACNLVAVKRYQKRRMGGNGRLSSAPADSVHVYGNRPFETEAV